MHGSHGGCRFITSTSRFSLAEGIAKDRRERFQWLASRQARLSPVYALSTLHVVAPGPDLSTPGGSIWAAYHELLVDVRTLVYTVLEHPLYG